MQLARARRDRAGTEEDSSRDRARTPEDAYLVRAGSRTWARRITLGPRLELPGLHSLDSPPGSAGSRTLSAAAAKESGAGRSAGRPNQVVPRLSFERSGRQSVHRPRGACQVPVTPPGRLTHPQTGISRAFSVASG